MSTAFRWVGADVLPCAEVDLVEVAPVGTLLDGPHPQYAQPLPLAGSDQRLPHVGRVRVVGAQPRLVYAGTRLHAPVAPRGHRSILPSPAPPRPAMAASEAVSAVPLMPWESA